jgi:putative endonuclease
MHCARMLGRMADSRQQRGIDSEALAAQHLQSHGIKILARNLRCRAGELDLVGLDGEILVIVEVRQRATRDFGGALASVNWTKQRKIIRATRYFLRTHPAWNVYSMRFDIVAVDGLPDGKYQIEWIKNAFCAR